MTKLVFEKGNIKNQYRFFQQTLVSKIKLGNIVDERGKIKITLSNQYRKSLERERIDLKEVISVIENDFKIWKKESSPLRNLSIEDKYKLQNKFKIINVLLVCLGDCVNDLSFLRKIDEFDGSLKELENISSILSKLDKELLHANGIDATIENGNIADDVQELITKLLNIPCE